MSAHYRKKTIAYFYKIALAILLLAAATGISGCGKDAEVSAMNDNAAQKEDNGVAYIYGIPMDENAAVVTTSVADLYESPDVKSGRITQVLYNQPVRVISNEKGWAEVEAVDGRIGWIKSKYIDSDVSSISGRSYTHRIIVTSKEKTITSGPSGGYTMMVASMGSEFYAFNSYDDAYEVFLPENKTGWLKGSGIIHIGLDEVIPVTNAEDFAATANRMKGVSFLLNGLSSQGIDSPGLVYICSRINGINLPRSIEGQLATGTEIKLEDAMAGDLVFLAGTGDEEKNVISCVGICIGDGNYIYAGRKTGYVAIGNIYKENPDGIAVKARRIFN